MNRQRPDAELFTAYMDQNYLTVPDVMKLLDVSRRTVENWRRGKHLIHHAYWVALRCMIEDEVPDEFRYLRPRNVQRPIRREKRDSPSSLQLR